MNEALKQRLVGAGVLLILTGLLWPLLFDFDDRLVRPAPERTVPPMPDLARVTIDPIDVADAALDVDSAPAADAARDDEASQDQDETPEVHNETPRLDEHGVPEAWVVQVGTFGQWNNATALRKRLLDKGYKAYIRPVVDVSPGPYRVYVGPLLTSAEASRVAGAIKSTYGLPDVLLRRFKAVDAP